MTAVAPTRDRLLRAARETIEERGYSAASVVVVAERAGVAAGTLYRHFASKEEMFVELFRAVCDRELAAMRAAAEELPADGTRAERIERVLSTFADRALSRPRLAWALIAEPVDPAVDAERLAYRARYAELVAGALAEAVAAGELPSQDVAVTAAALIGGCGEALVGPLAADSPDPQQTVDALRAFVRRAIGA
ncbi:MAG TPA: helix-turn-helix domain-containing protein [Solirubrobacteraceae bacterium]|nr:helix-turn-helix domain-containing protein [Solirubrobacteraceae bacterium]